MEKNKFENVSNEELLKEQKKLKSLNKIYGIVLFMLLITAIYLAISKSNFTIVAVFLALFSIFIVT
ncbi:hypothetical protein [Halpernia sp.]|uniref:hypothetical protein n=1 Tax=Halpernia sp. TaxID=2782209 RepID=UPI003A8E7BF8